MRAWIIGAAVALLAGGAQAQEVVFDDVVARVVVIPENRADLAVQVQAGGGSLPLPRVRRQGQRVSLDGDQRVQQCNTRNGVTTVRLRGGGQVRMSEAPLVTIRAPRSVSVRSVGNGALYGRIGPTQNLDLRSGGCSQWTVADVAGTLNVSQGGGARAVVGQARIARINASGGGSVTVRQVGDLQADASGGGVVRVAAVSGPMRADASGGGNVRVEGGRTGLLRAQASGGGWVEYRGLAEGLDAQASGGGRVRVARVTGPIDRRRASGGGSVTVGN